MIHTRLSSNILLFFQPSKRGFFLLSGGRSIYQGKYILQAMNLACGSIGVDVLLRLDLVQNLSTCAIVNNQSIVKFHNSPLISLASILMVSENVCCLVSSHKLICSRNKTSTTTGMTK